MAFQIIAQRTNDVFYNITEEENGGKRIGQRDDRGTRSSLKPMELYGAKFA